MWILMGSVSGKKARTSVTLSRNICAGSMTLRGVGGYSISPLKQEFTKYTSTGGEVHDVVGIYPASTNNLLIAASTDVFANTVGDTEYKINLTLSPDWVNLNTSPINGNRLSFGYKQSPIISMHEVNYTHDAPYHDSIDWIGEYSTSSGSIGVVGSSYVPPLVANHIDIPIHVNSVANDWLVFPVMHLVPVVTPLGCILDFTSKVKGTNPFTTDDLKQHSLTVFRKKLTASDITNGMITVTASGA